MFSKYNAKKLSNKELSDITKIDIKYFSKHRNIIEKIFILPKVDLHLHLGGSLRVETILDLAKEQNFELPAYSKNELAKIVSKDKYENLEDYLTVFGKITEPLLQEKSALERAAYELAEDLANENVIYFELRFAPMNYTHKKLKPYEVVRAVNAGLERAEKDFGIKSNMILCGVRIFSANMSPYHKKIATFFSCFNNKQLAQEVARNTAVLAVNANKVDGIKRAVGFDIAGPEKGYPAKNFVDAYKLIQKAGLYNTCHAGEAFGWQSIKQAIVDCGVDRIGHGTNLLDNMDLLEYVKGMKRIPVEICITSNIQTCENIKEYKSHPIGEFFKKHRLRIVICQDNRLVSNTTKTKENFIAHLYHNLTLQDLCSVELNGLKSGFMKSSERLSLIAQYVKYIETKFGVRL